MSDTIFNIRFFDFHLKIKKNLIPNISRNAYHRANKWPDGYFAIYDAPWMR